MKILSKEPICSFEMVFLQKDDGTRTYAIEQTPSDFVCGYTEAFYVFPQVAVSVLDHFINRFPEAQQSEIEEIVKQKFLEMFENRHETVIK